MRNFFKKVFNKLGWIFLCLFVASFALLSIAVTAGSIGTMVVKVFTIAGGGSWVRGLILTPFFIIGVVQIVRGFAAVIEKTEDKFNEKKNGATLFGLYFISTIIGYVAVVLSIVFWARS